MIDYCKGLTDEEIQGQIEGLEEAISAGDPGSLAMFCLEDYLAKLREELELRQKLAQ